MRDVTRISRILGKLSTAWQANPDQRLGQLVDNLIPSDTDLFNIEDEETEAAIDTYLTTGQWPSRRL